MCNYSGPCDLKHLHLTILSILKLAIQQHNCYIFNVNLPPF